jgi:6-phosphogluconolactonase (cycloisomerase 2 family)
MSSFPIALTIDPFGRFVYVSGGTFSTGTISAFTVNPVTGVLLPAPVPTYSLGGAADGIVEDPTGRFLYASVGPDFVAGYSIDPVTGTLTPVPGSPFSAGGNAVAITSGLAMDPLGRFLYADNTNSNAQGTGNVAAFQINPSTGALTLLTPDFAENYPIAMIVDPYGQILFNVDEITGDIENYGISQSNGQLSGPLSEVRFPANACPVGVAVHPSAPFVYVTVECTNPGWGLYGFKYDSTGFPRAISGSPFFPAEDPTAMTIDPSGKFAYASHFSLGSFEAYKIAMASGKLTSIVGSTVTTNDPAALKVLGMYK